MEIDGLAVTLLDTAGLRDTDDRVERIGIARAMERAEAADLRVFLTSDEPITGISARPEDIVVAGKADLTGEGISGKTGQGVADLISRIGEILQGRVANAATVTRERHRLALDRAIRAMESAQIEVERGADRAELAAAELRVAIRALESLVGRVDFENLLDEIFSSFCIGK